MGPFEPTEFLLVDDPRTMTARRIYLCYEPERDNLWIETVSRADASWPSALHYGHYRRWQLPDLVDAAALADVINAGELAPLLARIRAGASREWNGNNHVTRYTNDAHEAWAAVGTWCENQAPYLTGDNAGLWSASDALGDRDDYGITAATTDAEIAALADEIEREALVENMVVVGADELLTEWRDELRE